MGGLVVLEDFLVTGTVEDCSVEVSETEASLNEELSIEGTEEEGAEAEILNDGALFSI